MAAYSHKKERLPEFHRSISDQYWKIAQSILNPRFSYNTKKYRTTDTASSTSFDTDELWQNLSETQTESLAENSSVSSLETDDNTSVDEQSTTNQKIHQTDDIKLDTKEVNSLTEETVNIPKEENVKAACETSDSDSSCTDSTSEKNSNSSNSSDGMSDENEPAFATKSYLGVPDNYIIKLVNNLMKKDYPSSLKVLKRVLELNSNYPDGQELGYYLQEKINIDAGLYQTDAQSTQDGDPVETNQNLHELEIQVSYAEDFNENDYSLSVPEEEELNRSINLLAMSFNEELANTLMYSQSQLGIPKLTETLDLEDDDNSDSTPGIFEGANKKKVSISTINPDSIAGSRRGSNFSFAPSIMPPDNSVYGTLMMPENISRRSSAFSEKSDRSLMNRTFSQLSNSPISVKERKAQPVNKKFLTKKISKIDSKSSGSKDTSRSKGGEIISKNKLTSRRNSKITLDQKKVKSIIASEKSQEESGSSDESESDDLTSSEENDDDENALSEETSNESDYSSSSEEEEEEESGDSQSESDEDSSMSNENEINETEKPEIIVQNPKFQGRRPSIIPGIASRRSSTIQISGGRPAVNSMKLSDKKRLSPRVSNLSPISQTRLKSEPKDKGSLIDNSQSSTEESVPLKRK